jgi:alpha-L-fucosidase
MESVFNHYLALKLLTQNCSPMKKIILFLLLTHSFSAFSQQSYQPTPENLKARQWFDEARFGMFVHWGLSSSLGAGEWVMQQRNIKVEDYKRLMYGFYPAEFDASKWVATAKSAGMKYITLITRHHDGFSLWDTQQSDWKITNTPYKKDIVKQIADECNKQGIKLFFYYSLLDWYRDDYQYETGKTGKGTGRTKKSDMPAYINFMKAQLTELLTNYGQVGGIWFDGHWDQLDNDHDKTLQSKVDWKYDEIYALIHQLQPQALIGNNHHLLPLAGEDFQMFERDLPGENKGGLSGQEVAKAMPVETCETLNGSWGFNITDTKYKSVKELIHYLVKASGYGANFLLNIGPLPSGAIQTEFSERLKAMGEWMAVYGETIYGTKGGFARPSEQMAITEKGNKIYLHLFAVQDDLSLKIPYQIKSAKVFKDKKAIKFTKAADTGYYIFDLKGISKEEIDTVIEIER